MAGEILGHIECDGCGQAANIKKVGNSKALLYLHCPNCGLDRRSGAMVQAKWQAAIDSPQSLDGAQDDAVKDDGKDWAPSRTTHTNKTAENSEFIPASELDDAENPEPITGRNILTGVAVFLGFLGMALKSIRR
ncbi:MULTISPECIES: hypothetical protein [Shewanella]|uniref:Uncharacterized protein n=1 Tax=Shewanella scandinavica TaxID=3063538 RepID=A0ABU3FYM7_9GAMM|nr:MULTISPECIES: hypothetical protein [Shewanella]MCS6180956.1 hypothetical protein [Shewanella baltica]MCS6237979.1 hypothetical protein [Shewanella baltica]MCS6257304.1 hypothetical protein [Shewanella baltica]MDT3280477.1 hypothetical protein [Shewanella sp. SP2S1-2]